MKKKHSGINKNVKNGTRALIALLVAAAFILPTAAILADPVNEPNKDIPEETATDIAPLLTRPGIDPIQRPPILEPETDFGDMIVEAYNLETGESWGTTKYDPFGDDDEEDPVDTRGRDILLTEGFEDTWVLDIDGDYLAPDGWDVDGLSTCSQSGYPELYHYWGQYDDSMYPLPNSGSACAGLWWSDGTCGDFNQNEWIKTPVMDFSNCVDLLMTNYGVWNWISGPGNGDHYYVAITDDDVTWYNIQDLLLIQEGSGGPGGYGWCWNEYQVTTDISAAITANGLDASTIQIGFQCMNEYSSTLYGICMLDDVEITGTCIGDDDDDDVVWPDYDCNAQVNYIFIEDEIWDPEEAKYKIVPKIIHTDHEQACKNEYLYWEVYDDLDDPLPNDGQFCNRFVPGEHFIGAQIENSGNMTYYGLPVHLTVWKQIYEELLYSDFEDHVFSDWEVIDGGGCVHPYPDGDYWTQSDARSHSGQYSMHVSKTDSYMKGANDTLRNRYPLNTLGGDCSEITFWYWVEGEYDGYTAKAYDYLEVFWINRFHDGSEIRYGPLDVRVEEPGPVHYWSDYSDWWGHVNCMYNSGGPGGYADPVWAKGVIEIPDAWKHDQTFIEFVWHADCMEQFEGAYIDDVRVSKVINQGEKVYGDHLQVNITPLEVKFLKFAPPWGECCPQEHGKYWIEVRVKMHGYCDEEPRDDWVKDEILIECHHDVGVEEVVVEPCYQQSGEVFCHLIPVNTNFTIKNYSPYDDEFDVKMTVRNMEYEEIFFDDVESGNKGWQHGTFGGPDLWHITTRDAHSPTHSWAAMEEDVGILDRDMWNYLMSPTLNFEGLKDAWVCWNAKWALPEGAEFWWFIFDPYSNFIIRFSDGGSPIATGPSCSGGHLPDYDGYPQWEGPKNPAGRIDQNRYGYMCMPIMQIMDYLNDIGFGWLGVEMFGPEGHPIYRGGFGFAVITGSEVGPPACNNEKWSGVFVDDIKVLGLNPGHIVDERTWHLRLPGQGGEQTIYTDWCSPYLYGDFEVDIETLLDTDCNPDNNKMDGYSHIYYIKWLDDMEGYLWSDEHPFEDGWTHENLAVEASNWHIVQNIDPVEGYQNYWWCGDDDEGIYGPNWNDYLASPTFDLYSLLPRPPWPQSAVVLKFRTCFHLDVGDNFYVEVSDDDGRNWYKIWERNGPLQSDCWHDYELLIPQEYYTQLFKFRFHFQSDGLWEMKGVLLDDIILEARKGKIHEEGIEIFFDDWSVPPGEDPIADWNEIQYSGTGYWEVTEETYYKPFGYSGAFLAADSDTHTTLVYDVEIFTPSLDMTGETDVTIHFGRNFQDFAGDGYAEVNTYSGGFGPGFFEENLWNQGTDDPSGGVDTYFTIDPSTYAVPGDVYVGFYYSTEGGTYAWSFAIDNLEITSPSRGIIFEENFDVPFPHAPWVNVQTTTEVNYYPCYWSYMTYAYTSPPTCAGLWWGYEPQDELLMLPIDLSMYDSNDMLELEFETYVYGTYGGYWEYDLVQAYDGTSWTTLSNLHEEVDPYPSGNFFSYPMTYDVSFLMGSPDAAIAFYRVGNQPGDDTVLGVWFIDDVKLTAEVLEVGDPLCWFFEDDAETGGNPMWEMYQGVYRDGVYHEASSDLWRAFCYPIYHDPVYACFGEEVGPVYEQCDDRQRLEADEPWLFPPYDGEHFWMNEKHHRKPGATECENWNVCDYTYLNNMDNILISPPIDLQGAYHAHVFFAHIGQIAEGDEVWVCVRAQNDDGTWGPWNWIATSRSDYPCDPGIVPSINGPYAEHNWSVVNLFYGLAEDCVAGVARPYYTIDLMGYVWDQDIIQLGFRMVSDDCTVASGWKLDHIKVDVKEDKVAPTSTCDISGTMGCNDWYTSAVTVRLAAEDDLVGVKDIYYRIDGGAWTRYTDRFQVTGDGDHTIEYYAVDNVGNEEDIKTCESFKIDATNPSVGLTLPETGYLYIGGRPVVQTLRGKTIVIGELEATAQASDAMSGMDYVEFIVDGAVKAADLTSPYTFDLPRGGLLPATHTLEVKAYDNACNSATSQQLTYTKWF